jgi:mannitol-1-phosphate/altronate dehydrogenase
LEILKMSFLDDNMRIALDTLVKAQQKIMSGISELRKQDYVAEADDLALVLADLKAKTDAAIAAVNLP